MKELIRDIIKCAVECWKMDVQKSTSHVGVGVGVGSLIQEKFVFRFHYHYPLSDDQLSSLLDENLGHYKYYSSDCDDFWSFPFFDQKKKKKEHDCHDF